MRRLLPTLLILGVIVADVATTINLTHWSLRVPLPWPVYQAFAMFRVFDSWDVDNLEYVAEVRRLELNGAGASEWELFDLTPLFPEPPADALIRIGGLVRADPAGLLDEIWSAYERRHPGTIVEAVRLSAETWPKSPEGYEAERHHATRHLLAAR